VWRGPCSFNVREVVVTWAAGDCDAFAIWPVRATFRPCSGVFAVSSDLIARLPDTIELDLSVAAPYDLVLS